MAWKRLDLSIYIFDKMFIGWKKDNTNSQRLGVGRNGTRQVGPNEGSLHCSKRPVVVFTLKDDRPRALLANSAGGSGVNDGGASVAVFHSEDATDCSESEGHPSTSIGSMPYSIEASDDITSPSRSRKPSSSPSITESFVDESSWVEQPFTRALPIGRLDRREGCLRRKETLSEPLIPTVSVEIGW